MAECQLKIGEICYDNSFKKAVPINQSGELTKSMIFLREVPGPNTSEIPDSFRRRISSSCTVSPLCPHPSPVHGRVNATDVRFTTGKSQIFEIVDICYI
jgi:hypothetical protein